MSVHLQQSVAPSINATTGLWTYTWPPVSVGQTAQVTVAVPAALASTTWTVYNGSEPVATTCGGLPAGPFTVGPRQQITMTGVPAARTAPVPAIMQGEQGDPSEFGPLTPGSPGAAAPLPFQLIASSNSAVSSLVAYPSLSATGLLIVAGAVPSSVRLTLATTTGPSLPITQIGDSSGLLTLSYVPVFGVPIGLGALNVNSVTVNFASAEACFIYEVDTPTYPF